MAELILSRRDLEFVLYQCLQVEQLCERERYREHNRETFDAALDSAQKMATELFAPHNKKNDQHEPHFDGTHVTIIPEVKAALDAYNAAGFAAAGQDFADGGMQLPYVMEKGLSTFFTAANVATASYPFLSIGNANTILQYGTPEQIRLFARPQLAGRFFGTMCLSEPQAGSSLADIQTRAVFDAEQNAYRLTGNKMWISGGEHDLAENIVHLVLAKIPNQEGKLLPGVQGISLFIVPKFVLDEAGNPSVRNDVALAGLNHKMGHRGTVNCLLNFGEGKFPVGGQAGAIGYLVGKPQHGLAYMFHMMNEARIGVGLGAVALGYTGYLHALEYARTRLQGRERAQRDPSTPQIPLVQHADVRRMLLAQKAYVEGGLGLILYCSKLVDEQRSHLDEAERKRAGMLLDLLTPIAKSWPSQWCLAANDLAIQVHGGYGYTRDFNVEQFYRDNRLNAIHEGTHGIHALDLLGRKVVLQEGALLQAFAHQVARSVAACEHIPSLANYASSLAAMLMRVNLVTQHLYRLGDLNLTLANASVYLEAFGHLVVAWIWLDQARVAQLALPNASAQDADFYRGKLQACQYFFNWELPKIAVQLDLLEQADTSALAMQDAWF